MSGFGAPAFTPTPMPDFARSTRLQGPTLPALMCSTIDGADMSNRSHLSPAAKLLLASSVPVNTVVTLCPAAFSNCGTNSRYASSVAWVERTLISSALTIAVKIKKLAAPSVAVATGFPIVVVLPGRVLNSSDRPARRRAASLRSFADADAGVLDQWSPLVHFRLEKLSELRRRRADHEQAELLQTSLDRGIGQRGGRVGVYFLHDRRWRVGRHKEGIPSGDVETRQPRLRQRRQLWRRRCAFGGRHRERTQLALLHQRQQRRNIVEEDGDASGDDVLDCGRGAAIGHGRHLDPGRALE